jgi:hypothetical protein
VGANSTLNYFGNLLNGTADNSAPGFDWANDNVITGKMMKDANTAYRVRVRIGYNSTTDNDYSDPATGGVSVERKTTSMDISLGAGIQKYRGKGRLQGIYGAEASLGLGSGTESWDSDALKADVTVGSTFGFGVRGFIGAEYFFAPKMSLGGEFGWGLGISSTGETETTVNGGTAVKSGGGSSFGIDTDNAGGSISMNLYF